MNIESSHFGKRSFSAICLELSANICSERWLSDII